jgi:RNA polymerase sigma factor (sigma-70 family)
MEPETISGSAGLPDELAESGDQAFSDLRTAFERIKTGDREVFERLLPSIHAVAWPIVCRNVRGRENREDALQDADFKVFVYIQLTPEVPTPDHFRALIANIAKQRSIDFLRKNRSWWINVVSGETLIDRMTSNATTDHMSGGQAVDLERCLGELKERRRIALLLWSLGYSNDEIAYITGDSEGAIRNLIAHGKKDLRECMEGQVAEG